MIELPLLVALVLLALTSALLAGSAVGRTHYLRRQLEDLTETIDELEDDLEAFQAWAEASRYTRSEAE